MAVTPTERRIRAAAGVSTADIGASNREGWLGDASVDQQIAKLDAISKQRTLEARGAEKRYHPIMPDSLDEGAATALNNPALANTAAGKDGKKDLQAAFPASFLEAYDYYRTPRARHPRSVNRMLYVSGDKKMLFSAVNVTTKLFTQPALFIVGEKSDAMRFTQGIYDALPGQNKEIVVVQGVSHVDLYDRAPYVSQAVDRLADFFHRNLAAR